VYPDSWIASPCASCQLDRDELNIWQPIRTGFDIAVLNHVWQLFKGWYGLLLTSTLNWWRGAPKRASCLTAISTRIDLFMAFRMIATISQPIRSTTCIGIVVHWSRPSE
jgi:hypothetical protein